MRFAVIGALALCLTGCRRGPDFPVYNQVPSFALTDQTGQSYKAKDRLLGHVWVANFVFTSCTGPCPRMSSQMRQVRDATRDVAGRQLVSFTIDPQRDTPDKLAEYGKRFTADPKDWAFLTGSMAELNHIGKDVFMLQPVNGSLEHSTRFSLIDPQGRVRGYYDSSDPENLRRLIEDVHKLANAQ